LSKKNGESKGNPQLFMILVDLFDNDKPNDYYIFKYDEFAKRVQKISDDNMQKKKKGGGSLKEFWWFDEKLHWSSTDKLNNWDLLGL
jgi:hypothetical protein